MDWVTLRLRLDDILKFLEELESQGYLSVTIENQIQTLKFELRSLRMHAMWRRWLVPFALDAVRDLVTDVEMRLLLPTRTGNMAADLLEETLSSLSQSMKPGEDKYKIWCLHNECPLKELLIDELVMELIDPLLKNLKYLIRCNDLNLQVFPKEQIEALVEKLRSLRNFLEITGAELEEVIKNITSRQGLLHKTSKDLLTRIKMLIGDAIYRSYDLWAKPEQGRMEKLIFDLVVRINHIEPEMRMICVQIMKASKTANLGTLGIDLQALAAVDSLLDNLQKLLKNRDTGSFMHLDVRQIEFLHPELSFLKCFLMDPHLKQYNETEPESFNSLLIQVEALARGGASLTHSICGGQTKDHIADEMNLLHSNLLNVVNLLKAEIRQMYLRVSKPSSSSFPQTPKLGFLDFFLQSLDELLKHRADSIAYVKNEIEIVQTELRFLSTFVSNTIKKPEEDEHIARRVVAVAYEAECVIDLISASNFPRWHYMLWLSDVIEKIKRLKDSTEVCSKKTCDISVLNVDKASVHDPPQAYSLIGEEEVVGFTDQAEKIKDKLFSSQKELDIVSIVGMPGLGKTTLAKKVYEDPSIRSHFHVRSWYCISQVYEMRELLLGILRDVTHLTAEKILNMDEEDTAHELYKSLRGRRYLVVLDDIWSTEPWEKIRHSFPDDGIGSRILFTSRYQEVASQAIPGSAPLDLPLFSHEESWELLQNKVFKQRSCPPELYEIGRQIANNCKGLPLCVVVIAGVLMRLEECEDQWKQVLESLGQHVAGDSKCTDALELSYKHLPDYLKPCFLYLGAFPEDKEIPTWKLIRLWIAEGLVQKTESKSLEDIAEGYLKDLIARSLVLISQNKSNGGVKSCQLHDLLREFSLKKAKDENFLQISKEVVNPEQYRHCFYCQEKSLYTWMPYDPYVRSVLYFPTERIICRSRYCLHHLDLSVLPYILKLLRVLDFEHVYRGAKFPTEIKFLVHLRYLAVRGEIVRVPLSIGNLWRLETLRVIGNMRPLMRKTGGVKLPETLLKMARLKHVHVEKWAIFDLSDTFQPEKSCPCIQISRPKLRHGDVNSEKVIGSLQSVRKLKCIFVESSDHSICNRLPVLDSLSELESLNVTYDGLKKGPFEFSFPLKLKKLTLSEFRLPWTEISKIGRLPHLEVLKLLSRAFEGRRWDVSDDEFRNLKFLKLEGLDIVEWDAFRDPFPCLEQLVLRRCAKLQEIPSIFGELAALRVIEVQWCSDSATKAMQEIQEQQKDLGSHGLKVLIRSS